jgi:tetratricopeptide (TPR) repeat protein
VKSVPLSGELKLKIIGSRCEVFLLERKYQDTLKEAESLPDEQIAAFPGGLWAKYYYVGFARKLLHDDVGARAAFEKSKGAAEERVRRSPDSEDAHIQLARVLAQLGEKEAAVAEAQRATELLPESKDAFGGPEITASVAEVYATVGENDRAIEILDGLLTRPSAITVESLKISPLWDPLRSDPQFQTLLEKHGAKT